VGQSKGVDWDIVGKAIWGCFSDSFWDFRLISFDILVYNTVLQLLRDIMIHQAPHTPIIRNNGKSYCFLSQLISLLADSWGYYGFRRALRLMGSLGYAIDTKKDTVRGKKPRIKLLNLSFRSIRFEESNIHRPS
jgi:hypothetical protein